MKQKLDTLFINDLTIPCIIGVYENERQEKQNVIINLALSLDTKKAGKTDDVNDTVNYHDLALQVAEMVSNSHFFLLEKLAQAIADVCFRYKKVEQVTVRIEKPKAVKTAKSSAIEITRYNT